MLSDGCDRLSLVDWCLGVTGHFSRTREYQVLSWEPGSDFSGESWWGWDGNSPTSGRRRASEVWWTLSFYYTLSILDFYGKEMLLQIISLSIQKFFQTFETLELISFVWQSFMKIIWLKYYIQILLLALFWCFLFGYPLLLFFLPLFLSFSYSPPAYVWK